MSFDKNKTTVPQKTVWPLKYRRIRIRSLQCIKASICFLFYNVGIIKLLLFADRACSNRHAIDIVVKLKKIQNLSASLHTTYQFSRVLYQNFHLTGKMNSFGQHYWKQYFPNSKRILRFHVSTSVVTVSWLVTLALGWYAHMFWQTDHWHASQQFLAITRDIPAVSKVRSQVCPHWDLAVQRG